MSKCRVAWHGNCISFQSKFCTSGWPTHFSTFLQNKPASVPFHYRRKGQSPDFCSALTIVGCEKSELDALRGMRHGPSLLALYPRMNSILFTLFEDVIVPEKLPWHGTSSSLKDTFWRDEILHASNSICQSWITEYIRRSEHFRLAEGGHFYNSTGSTQVCTSLHAFWRLLYNTDASIFFTINVQWVERRLSRFAKPIGNLLGCMVWRSICSTGTNYISERQSTK